MNNGQSCQYKFSDEDLCFLFTSSKEAVVDAANTVCNQYGIIQTLDLCDLQHINPRSIKEYFGNVQCQIFTAYERIGNSIEALAIIAGQVSGQKATGDPECGVAQCDCQICSSTYTPKVKNPHIGQESPHTTDGKASVPVIPDDIRAKLASLENVEKIINAAFTNSKQEQSNLSKETSRLRSLRSSRLSIVPEEIIKRDSDQLAPPTDEETESITKAHGDANVDTVSNVPVEEVLVRTDELSVTKSLEPEQAAAFKTKSKFVIEIHESNVTELSESAETKPKPNVGNCMKGCTGLKLPSQESALKLPAAKYLYVPIVEKQSSNGTELRIPKPEAHIVQKSDLESPKSLEKASTGVLRESPMDTLNVELPDVVDQPNEEERGSEMSELRVPKPEVHIEQKSDLEPPKSLEQASTGVLGESPMDTLNVELPDVVDQPNEEERGSEMSEIRVTKPEVHIVQKSDLEPPKSLEQASTGALGESPMNTLNVELPAVVDQPNEQKRGSETSELRVPKPEKHTILKSDDVPIVVDQVRKENRSSEYPPSPQKADIEGSHELPVPKPEIHTVEKSELESPESQNLTSSFVIKEPTLDVLDFGVPHELPVPKPELHTVDKSQLELPKVPKQVSSMSVEEPTLVAPGIELPTVVSQPSDPVPPPQEPLPNSLIIKANEPSKQNSVCVSDCSGIRRSSEVIVDQTKRSQLRVPKPEYHTVLKSDLEAPKSPKQISGLDIEVPMAYEVSQPQKSEEKCVCREDCGGLRSKRQKSVVHFDGTYKCPPQEVATPGLIVESQPDKANGRKSAHAAVEPPTQMSSVMIKEHNLDEPSELKVVAPDALSEHQPASEVLHPEQNKQASIVEKVEKSSIQNSICETERGGLKPETQLAIVEVPNESSLQQEVITTEPSVQKKEPNDDPSMKKPIPVDANKRKEVAEVLNVEEIKKSPRIEESKKARQQVNPVCIADCNRQNQRPPTSVQKAGTIHAPEEQKQSSEKSILKVASSVKTPSKSTSLEVAEEQTKNEPSVKEKVVVDSPCELKPHSGVSKSSERKQTPKESVPREPMKADELKSVKATGEAKIDQSYKEQKVSETKELIKKKRLPTSISEVVTANKLKSAAESEKGNLREPVVVDGQSKHKKGTEVSHPKKNKEIPLTEKLASECRQDCFGLRSPTPASTLQPISRRTESPDVRITKGPTIDVKVSQVEKELQRISMGKLPNTPISQRVSTKAPDVVERQSSSIKNPQGESELQRLSKSKRRSSTPIERVSMGVKTPQVNPEQTPTEPGIPPPTAVIPEKRYSGVKRLQEGQEAKRTSTVKRPVTAPIPQQVDVKNKVEPEPQRTRRNGEATKKKPEEPSVPKTGSEGQKTGRQTCPEPIQEADKLKKPRRNSSPHLSKKISMVGQIPILTPKKEEPKMDKQKRFSEASKLDQSQQSQQSKQSKPISDIDRLLITKTNSKPPEMLVIDEPLRKLSKKDDPKRVGSRVIRDAMLANQDSNRGVLHTDAAIAAVEEFIEKYGTQPKIIYPQASNDSGIYQSMAGSSRWVSGSRPDIAGNIRKLSLNRLPAQVVPGCFMRQLRLINECTFNEVESTESTSEMLDETVPSVVTSSTHMEPPSNNAGNADEVECTKFSGSFQIPVLKYSPIRLPPGMGGIEFVKQMLLSDACKCKKCTGN